MNETVIRPGVINRIIEKSKNKPYSAEVVNDILTAFFDVIEDEIAIGNTVKLNRYMTILPQHRPQKTIYGVSKGKKIVIPEHYRAYIKVGSRFNQSAERLTKRVLGDAQ